MPHFSDLGYWTVNFLTDLLATTMLGEAASDDSTAVEDRSLSRDQTQRIGQDASMGCYKDSMTKRKHISAAPENGFVHIAHTSSAAFRP